MIVLTGLRRVIGSHAGEVIAEQVIQVIQEYGMEKRLGYFVLDNATSNDTCVKAILHQLRSNLIKKERRLRCVGHIINIAAQAFLYDNDKEAFTAEVHGARSLADVKKQLDIWRKKGPIGKLHNIVTFIRRIPQHREGKREEENRLKKMLIGHSFAHSSNSICTETLVSNCIATPGLSLVDVFAIIPFRALLSIDTTQLFAQHSKPG